MAEKVTTMVLKVDLQCPSCYKKIKKVLAKFPQIRNQIFDEKQNTVTITVVCCSPEKIRYKLCSKAGKAIKSIEIMEPPKFKENPKEKTKELEKSTETAKSKEAEKPKETEKPKEPGKPTETVKPKEAENPKQVEKQKEAEKPKPDPEKPMSNGKAEENGKPAEKPKETPPNPSPAPAPPNDPEPAPPAAVPVHGFPPVYPIRVCCGQCYEGNTGGPCYGRPVPCYDGYGYSGNRVCYVTRCDDYFNEENTSGCTIM